MTEMTQKEEANILNILNIPLDLMQGMKRTHYCGEVGEGDLEKEVILCGWVARRRDHGGLIFIDLRDRSGLVQIVFSPEVAKTAFQKAETVRNEYVLLVRGVVKARSENTVNAALATGKIEVYGNEIRILNTSKTTPFYIQDNIDVDESLRLKYRYLDLRRPQMQKDLMLRHRVAKSIRDFLDSKGFIEIETPMLTKSTPEGARDYLVPSRVNPGKFYALPQSPQIFKQLLMVAGMERYFQIVKCFRDEDLRADRQPEFTQLDIEMSFVEREDVLSIMEELIAHVFKTSIGAEVKTPFVRLSYEDAMNRYGSDKPDLRFGMELTDISEAVRGSGFKVFDSVLAAGGKVKAINVRGQANIARRELDGLVDYAGIYGAKGLAWICYAEEGIKSPISKFFTAETLEKISILTSAEKGDLLLIVADKPQIASAALGQLRLEMAKRLNLIDESKFSFLWVLDFPMFELDEENNRWQAMHHPFTSPVDEDVPKMTAEQGKVRAKAYDMVLNGCELGGGSIRVYNRPLQEKVFASIGLTPQEAVEKFGFLLEAFEYGTPPHGGIAFGLDRMIMLMAGRSSIRDVIAFPKTQSASDLMCEAPAGVSDKQLKELFIKSEVVLKK